MFTFSGTRSETSAKVSRGTDGYETEGVRGLKTLGVRDLTYKMAFLACTVTPTNSRVSMLQGTHRYGLKSFIRLFIIMLI